MQYSCTLCHFMAKCIMVGLLISNPFFLLWNSLLYFDHLSQEWSLCGPTKVVQTVLIGCINRSWGQKVGFQNAIFKNLVLNHITHSFYTLYWFEHHLEVLYQSCSNYAPGVNIDPALGVTSLHGIIFWKSSNDVFSQNGSKM